MLNCHQSRRQTTTEQKRDLPTTELPSPAGLGRWDAGRQTCRINVCFAPEECTTRDCSLRPVNRNPTVLIERFDIETDRGGSEIGSVQMTRCAHNEMSTKPAKMCVPLNA